MDLHVNYTTSVFFIFLTIVFTFNSFMCPTVTIILILCEPTFLELSEDVWGGAFNALVSDEVSTRMSYKLLYMQNIFYTLYLRVVNNFTGCNRRLNKVGD